jgi:hypothetical protein
LIKPISSARPWVQDAPINQQASWNRDWRLSVNLNPEEETYAYNGEKQAHREAHVGQIDDPETWQSSQTLYQKKTVQQDDDGQAILVNDVRSYAPTRDGSEDQYMYDEIQENVPNRRLVVAQGGVQYSGSGQVWTGKGGRHKREVIKTNKELLEMFREPSAQAQYLDLAQRREMYEQQLLGEERNDINIIPYNQRRNLVTQTFKHETYPRRPPAVESTRGLDPNTFRAPALTDAFKSPAVMDSITAQRREDYVVNQNEVRAPQGAMQAENFAAPDAPIPSVELLRDKSTQAPTPAAGALVPGFQPPQAPSAQVTQSRPELVPTQGLVSGGGHFVTNAGALKPSVYGEGPSKTTGTTSIPLPSSAAENISKGAKGPEVPQTAERHQYTREYLTRDAQGNVVPVHLKIAREVMGQEVRTEGPYPAHRPSENARGNEAQYVTQVPSQDFPPYYIPGVTPMQDVQTWKLNNTNVLNRQIIAEQVGREGVPQPVIGHPDALPGIRGYAPPPPLSLGQPYADVAPIIPPDQMHYAEQTLRTDSKQVPVAAHPMSDPYIVQNAMPREARVALDIHAQRNQQEWQPSGKMAVVNEKGRAGMQRSFQSNSSGLQANARLVHPVPARPASPVSFSNQGDLRRQHQVTKRGMVMDSMPRVADASSLASRRPASPLSFAQSY